MLPGDHRELMYSWVDHVTMKNKNQINKKLTAVSVELTGTNNKLIHRQFQNLSHQKYPNNGKGKGFWSIHLLWNYKMLCHATYKKSVLNNLQVLTGKFKDNFYPSILQTAGMIYAMIHLPTNSIFVIATKKKISTSFKQHWYSAYIRNTKFHRILQEGRLRDVMVWPLEKFEAYNTHHAIERKKHWIHTLLGGTSKKWVKKQFVDVTTSASTLRSEQQINQPVSHCSSSSQAIFGRKQSRNKQTDRSPAPLLEHSPESMEQPDKTATTLSILPEVSRPRTPEHNFYQKDVPSIAPKETCVLEVLVAEKMASRLCISSQQMIQVFEDEKPHEQNTQLHLSRQGSFMANHKSDDKWTWKEEDEAKQAEKDKCTEEKKIEQQCLFDKMTALQNKQEEQQTENHINSQSLTPVSYEDKIHLFSYEELCIEHSQKRLESLAEYKRKRKETVLSKKLDNEQQQIQIELRSRFRTADEIFRFWKAHENTELSGTLEIIHQDLAYLEWYNYLSPEQQETEDREKAERINARSYRIRPGHNASIKKQLEVHNYQLKRAKELQDIRSRKNAI